MPDVKLQYSIPKIKKLTQMMRFSSKMIHAFVNSIIPPYCYGCKMRVYSGDIYLCEECKLLLIQPQKFINGAIDPFQRHFYSAGSIYLYNNLMKILIHEFKFNGKKNVGHYLTENAIEKIKTQYPEFLKVDGMIAVPMLPATKRSRRYNQSEIICDIVSKNFNLTNWSNKISKNIFTIPRSRQTYNERIIPHNNAYKLKKGFAVKDKIILIIDDVFTTGSTVNELSQFLKENGANRVYVLTLTSVEYRKGVSHNDRRSIKRTHS